jgi:integrase
MPGKRRGNGEGTITQRPDGTWRGSLTLPDGRRKDFRAKTQEEARRTLTRLTRERDQGVLLQSDERLSVATYLADWLQRQKPRLEASSDVRYTEQMAHVTKALGRVRLLKLTSSQLERLYADLLAAGLSSSSVANLHTTLKSALADAVRKRILLFNPAETATAPRIDREEIQPLDERQANAFLIAARGDRLEALFILALRTGMRKGELAALHWQDVDLERGTLLVRLSLRRLKGGGFVFNQPKTKASRRTIRLSPTVVEALKAHRARQAEERLFLGAAWQDHGLVFPSTIGTPQDAQGLLNRVFKRILASAGLPSTTRFHDLRHTCATLLLLRGIDANTVKDLLGHANISITLNVYGHVLPNMCDRVAEMMDTILAPSATA